MKLNKVLKGLTLAVLVITITSCSSCKRVNSGDKSSIGANIDNGMDININNVLPYEQARLQIQNLKFNNVVYFDLDKYNIHSEFFRMLDTHANFLRSNLSYKIVVEGHADERGTPEYNIALGERRANALKMYLQGKGVSASQITIVSYGKEKPAILGHDETAYAKNRRAIIIY